MRQFTATVFILHEARALLLFHKKHQTWMPPGGHIEPNETPAEAARREVLEETGLEIMFVGQENIWFDEQPPITRSIERPHHMLLEYIPAVGVEPAHEHIDFCYVARPTSSLQPCERQEIRWFTLEQIESLPPASIFPDVQKTLIHLLAHEKSHFCSGHRPACR